MKRQRIEYLDYAKAFAVFAVLLTHSYFTFPGMNCFTMAVFFIAAGYTYHSDHESFKEFFVKKLKRLMVPFWLVMAMSVLLEIVRAPFIGYGTVREVIPILANLLYGSGLFPNCGKLGQLLINSTPFTYNSRYMIDIIMPTNCHAWTLPAMFTGYLIFYCYRKTVKKKSTLSDVAAIAVMLLLASIETVPGIFQLPFGIGRGLFCAALMIAGFWFKEHDTFEDTNKIRIFITLAVCAAVTVISVLLGSYGSDLVISNYGPYGVLSVILTFLGGLCSSYLMIMLCRFLHMLSIKPLNNMLAVVGRNTMEIYLWHFAVFFVFDAIFILTCNPVVSPSVYVDELFNDGYCLYRVLRIILTVVCLSLYGEMKGKKKKRILLQGV